MMTIYLDHWYLENNCLKEKYLFPSYPSNKDQYLAGTDKANPSTNTYNILFSNTRVKVQCIKVKVCLVNLLSKIARPLSNLLIKYLKK